MDVHFRERTMERCRTCAFILLDVVVDIETAINELSAANHKSLEKEGKRIVAVLQQIEQAMPFSIRYTVNHCDTTRTILLSILR